MSVSTQTQSNSLDQLELVNLSGLTYAVEGIVGQQNLGTFYGPFDVKAVGHTPGVLTDYKGAVTTRFTLSAHLLQGTFTGATTDYLQAFESATARNWSISRSPAARLRRPSRHRSTPAAFRSMAR